MSSHRQHHEPEHKASGRWGPSPDTIHQSPSSKLKGAEQLQYEAEGARRSSELIAAGAIASVSERDRRSSRVHFTTRLQGVHNSTDRGRRRTSTPADAPLVVDRDGPDQITSAPLREQLFFFPPSPLLNDSVTESHRRSAPLASAAAPTLPLPPPPILLTRPSIPIGVSAESEDGMSSIEVQLGDSDASRQREAPSTGGKAGGRRRSTGPSLRLPKRTLVPFPPPITPTRARYDSDVLAGLRTALSPPGHTAQYASASMSFCGTPTPQRQHFSSFRTDDEIVEIPRFKKRELNLGIVRGHGRHGRRQVALWLGLWAAWVGNALLSSFFDVNIMYMLTQCALAPLSGKVWVLLSVGYAVCWALSVLMWLGYGLGFQFYRRWRRARPAIEPIYLSSYANIHLSLISLDHFCFLLHIRTSPWGTAFALDIVPETCHFVVQLLPSLIPVVVRAGMASVLLLWHWDLEGRDPNFFLSDPATLTPYARGVVLAFCAWVALRLASVLLSGATLLLFLARPLSVASNSTEQLLRDKPRRDPAASQFPAKSWRDENELKWAWRERARARIQDAFELCIVRPTRSQVTLEKIRLPPHQRPPKVHQRGESAPTIPSLDFAHLRNQELPIPLSPPLDTPKPEPREEAQPQPHGSRRTRKPKQSTAPLTFAATFDSGMKAFDKIELGALYEEISPMALFHKIGTEEELGRVMEEGNERPPQSRGRTPSPSEVDLPAASRSLASLPVTSPITLTFDVQAGKPPHPLDAATEQTYTAHTGPVSFEVWGKADAWRLSGSSVGNATNATFGTFGDSMSDPLPSLTLTHNEEEGHRSFEVLGDSWDHDETEFGAMFPGIHHARLEAEHPPVTERFRRGNAFLDGKIEDEELVDEDGRRTATSMDRTLSPALALDSYSPPSKPTRPHMPLSPTIPQLPVLAKASAPKLAIPPPPAPPPSPPPSPLPPLPHLSPLQPTTPGPTAVPPFPAQAQPLTPPRRATADDALKVSALSSPQADSSHETINESELFYHPPSPSPRRRRSSTVVVGLRSSAIPKAPGFCAPNLDSPLLLLSTGRPSAEHHRSLSTESAEGRDPDLDPTPPGSDERSDATLKGSKWRVRTLEELGDPSWLQRNGEISPAHSRSASDYARTSSNGHTRTSSGGHGRTASNPLAPMTMTNSTPSAPSNAAPAPATNLVTSPSSLRRRPVPSRSFSAFPPPPSEPEGTEIPPPLPSSFSRGYRSRMARGGLPIWRGDKSE